MLMLAGFVTFLFYMIIMNLINGRKFHHNLEQQFSKIRLSNMLAALRIDRTEYMYQTSVNNIRQQMKSCSDCGNTKECDDKLSNSSLDITDIAFCNNEEELIDIKRQQDMKLSEKGSDN